jgi:adenylylsulfate kinase-like enzyme
LVSPYIDQREEFKDLLKDKIIEIYVHTTDIRGRENYHVEGYQKPLKNFINLDTTGKTPEESLITLKNEIQFVHREVAALAFRS